MAYYVKNLNDYCEKCVAENVSMFQVLNDGDCL